LVRFLGKSEVKSNFRNVPVEQETVRRQSIFSLSRILSNPDPLDFAKAHVIVARVIKARRLRVLVAGHALRHLDTSPVFR
jgi:hypothetical protein